MKTFTQKIYGNWIAGATDDGLVHDIKLTKLKKSREEDYQESFYLPRKFLIDLGKWLEAQDNLEQIEAKLNIKKT